MLAVVHEAWRCWHGDVAMAMVQVMHERPATWKKVRAVSQALAVRQERSYHLNDEDETEVEPENIAKGNHSPLTSAPGLSLPPLPPRVPLWQEPGAHHRG